MKQRLFFVLNLLLLAALLFSSLGSVKAQEETPGAGSTDPALSAASSQSLSPILNEYGKIKLSTDALGTLTSQGSIHVDKPKGGKVRKAFFLAATTGFTNYQLASDDIKLNGSVISWEKEIANSISSYNYLADVTGIIKPKIDGAPAGVMSLTVEEKHTAEIDGTLLAVVFDDPAQPTNNTVILYFGAQNITGDTFTINTGSPINTTDPNLKVTMSLGISYGYLPSNQYSQIDVNGKRLTTSAGGQDDGQSSNGALITVGGIGDSDSNPPDPNYSSTSDFRYDDELYNLKPYIQNNDSTITINTVNPSNDDNIFFSALILSSTSTVQALSVSISLYNNPTTAEGMAPYEAIIGYFADAVYEASNGVNKIGQVTIYSNQSYQDTANVVWKEKGWPSSSVAGFGIDGKHINMYDIFKDGGGPGVDYNFLANDQHQKMSGYTLAHEFGHLYYSLYDEYKCTSGKEVCDDWEQYIHMPHAADNPVTNSIMNSQWNAVGLLGNNFNWLNFSIAKNIKGDAAQTRVYNASGWDTLVRPLDDDPRDGERTNQAVRLYHSDLVDGKPSGSENAQIDLPGDARSDLRITWFSHLLAGASLDSKITLAAAPVYTAELNSTLGQNISYPEPILLMAFVHSDLNLSGLHVTGSVTLPNGTSQAVTFADDGVAPDVTKGDGLYAAIIGYNQEGLYTIQVIFDNHAHKAARVSNAFMLSTDVNGNSGTHPEPELIAEDFELTKTLLVSVANVVADDHANTASAATGLTNDNHSTAGKIDYVGDIDFFKVTTLPKGETYVRVTNLALGMTPHLRVFASNKTTLLFEADLPAAGAGLYLNRAFWKIAPNTTLYLNVTDKNNLSGGLYDVSVGAGLASDNLIQHMYLPYIKK